MKKRTDLFVLLVARLAVIDNYHHRIVDGGQIWRSEWLERNLPLVDIEIFLVWLTVLLEIGHQICRRLTSEAEIVGNPILEGLRPANRSGRPIRRTLRNPKGNLGK